MLVEYGRLPWIALFLAFSFSIYGLIRKIVNVMPLPGLFIETLFLSFPALIYLIFFAPAREAWPAATPLCLLLISSGVATSLPLWAFTFSAKNLSLVTVGLLQFIAPSLRRVDRRDQKRSSKTYRGGLCPCERSKSF